MKGRNTLVYAVVRRIPRGYVATYSQVAMARQVGAPFQPPLGNASGIDPIAEWLNPMEVVQMLCPVWPVRESPMQGNHWRL